MMFFIIFLIYSSVLMYLIIMVVIVVLDLGSLRELNPCIGLMVMKGFLLLRFG